VAKTEKPHERGERHLRESGYSDHEKKKKRARGGHIPGMKAEGRPDRRGRAAGGESPRPKPQNIPMIDESRYDPDRDRTPMPGRPINEPAPLSEARARGGDLPDDAQGNVHANSALARGGKHKGKGKVTININAAQQGDPQHEQMAHEAGIQQGAKMGAQAVAAKMAGGAGGPPPMAGGPPRPPMGAPMMPPPGGPPMMGPGGPPPGAGGPPPGGMPPKPPGMMARGGEMRRRDEHGRFTGGAV
jgi:hypothetical protein